MGRAKEILQMLKNIMRYSLFPVYELDDIASGDNPAKKVQYDHTIAKEELKETLRILSWNILRNYNPEKIHDSLKAIFAQQNPTVIFIQEAPVHETSSFWEGPLLERFNFYYAPLHQVKKKSAYYDFLSTGQLILSSHPMKKTKTYQLPSVSGQLMGDEHVIKRIALYAQLEKKDGRTVGLYNVHFENNCWHTGRKKQVEFLCDLVEENADDIVVIGGDFNTFLYRAESGLTLLEHLGFERLMSGFRFLPRLDHFFVKGANAQGFQLYGSGSDHQPIMVEIDF